MKASDVFGIIVRTIGFCLLLLAPWYFLYGFIELGGWIPEERAGETLAMFITGVSFAVVGLAILRGASSFVRFSYPTDAAQKDCQPQAKNLEDAPK